MALPERHEKLQERFLNIKDEPVSTSKGVVFIKDPKKRRKCPLCRNNLYLYHINYEEMFLMCENSLCDFPFGYEALQIVRHENELVEKPEKASRDFFEYPTAGGNELSRTVDSILGAPTATISSMSGVSDTDGLSQMGDSDDLSLDKTEISMAKLSRQKNRSKERQKNIELQSNLSHIKKMTEVMNKLNQESEFDNKVIKNPKWLNNLQLWEAETGKKFLTGQEKSLVKIEPKSSELKICVDSTTAGDMPAFNIHIVSDLKEESQTRTDNVEK